MACTGTGKASSYCMGVIVCMMVLGVAMSELTCCDVKPVLKACGDYVKTGGDPVPLDCCMQTIELRNKVMRSRHTQQIACHCIQQAAQNCTDHINSTAYASIPSRCGVNLPYHFSIDMDCDLLV